MLCSLHKYIALILTASLLGICGCNRGKTIIDEATGVYLEGDALEAARILRRVELEAPNTAEVSVARSLAVEWLTRKSEIELGESRRTYLIAALEWAPHDSNLNSRRCEVELDLKQWEAARACLHKVDGRIPIPDQQRQEEILAAYDKSVADTTKRRRLLETDDPLSLYRLLSEFPGSDESKKAEERLPELSLCADLKRFAEVLFTGGQTGPNRWGARLREQGSQGYQRTVLSDIRRSSKEISDRLESLEPQLRDHPVMIDENEVLDHLLEGYSLLHSTMKALHSSFGGKAYKIQNRIKKVDRFARGFLETSLKIEEQRNAATEACKALGR